MPSFGEEVIRIDDCRGVGATDKALWVELPDGSREWIPQSQIDDDSEVWKEGDRGMLIIGAWIAAQKGIA